MVGKIVRLLVASIVGVVGFSIIQSAVSTLDTTGFNSAQQAMVSVLPVVSAVVIVFGAFIGTFGGAETVRRYLKWQDFGSRLKTAYTAKFGYPNPGFNEEVDQHILTMRTLSEGTEMNTKKLAEDWLKRMAHMCEVKFVIPEEEDLSETEKTEELSREGKE